MLYSVAALAALACLLHYFGVVWTVAADAGTMVLPSWILKTGDVFVLTPFVFVATYWWPAWLFQRWFGLRHALLALGWSSLAVAFNWLIFNGVWLPLYQTLSVGRAVGARWVVFLLRDTCVYVSFLLSDSVRDANGNHRVSPEMLSAFVCTPVYLYNLFCRVVQVSSDNIYQVTIHGAEEE